MTPSETFAAFCAQWAPDRGSYDEYRFNADLAHLMNVVRQEAVKPFVDAAAAQLALRPMQPIILKDDKK